jgi:hypothetical protein
VTCAWIEELLGGTLPGEGETAEGRGRQLTELRGLPRDQTVSDPAQVQTRAVKAWCEEAGLMIERLKVEETGIAVFARRPAAA